MAQALGGVARGLSGRGPVMFGPTSMDRTPWKLVVVILHLADTSSFGGQGKGVLCASFLNTTETKNH